MADIISCLVFRKAPTDAEDSYEPFTRWINLNSFGARLFALGLLKCCPFGYWTMRISFEDDRPGTPSADLLECRVEAAAQWIEHAAKPFFRSIARGSGTYSPIDMIMRRTGSWIFYGHQARSRERWDFWKGQFQEIGSGDKVSDEVKQTALASVRKMEEVEREWEMLMTARRRGEVPGGDSEQPWSQPLTN